MTASLIAACLIVSVGLSDLEPSELRNSTVGASFLGLSPPPGSELYFSMGHRYN
jgi:hypothetical protein